MSTMPDDAAIADLERAVDVWLAAKRSVRENNSYGYSRADTAMVDRKLMAVDEAMMNLYRDVPERYLDGDEQTPQEYARAVAAILRAGNAMNGIEQPAAIRQSKEPVE